jgi:quinol monooxygenase YgiN
MDLRPLKTKRKEFLKTLPALLEAALSLGGCAQANCYSDLMERGRYIFYLSWEMPHQLYNYLESDSFKALMGMKNFMSSKPRITVQYADEKIAVEGAFDNVLQKLKKQKYSDPVQLKGYPFLK